MVATQQNRHAGYIAVAVLLIAVSLAGCIGSEAGGNAAPADDVSNDSAQDVDDTSTDDAENQTPETEPQAEDGDEQEEEKEKPPRIPSDAMEADPDETKQGMAHFVFEGSVGPSAPECLFVCPPDQPVHVTESFEIVNPGDLTFLDAYVRAGRDQGSVTDYDLYLYNQSGGTLASSASSGDDEYIFLSPTQGENATYTLVIDAWLNAESTYTLDVWAWTAEDWSANHPFTDVFEKRYEWGQVEAATPVAAVSLVWGPGDPTGATEDGSIDIGGYGWSGCASNGGGNYLLPCPEQPYTSVSIVIDDDVAGQQVAAIFTTCSNDNDPEAGAPANLCGETDNRNDSVGNPGPNELRATFCGVVQGITRDANTPKDGTGPGIWDQRGEEYLNADGEMVAHPGVSDMVVFLRGPQRGGGGICSDANPYTGPTTGTITVIAKK